ncbi:MAG: hypothetical protein ILA25_02310 [Prevotella sp.]|nr:hypothetical protein [Prevotella sp.]
MKQIFLVVSCWLLAVGTTLTSCTDSFEKLDNEQPDWLGENIYDYLKGRGDCNYYTRLIDDCGLTEVMRRTGSNTLFFTSDNAFDEYFAANLAKGSGPTSYEEMSATEKNMMISLGRISNAQLIERLCEGDIKGTVLRRSTYFGVTDSIPLYKKADLLARFPGNAYFEALEGDTVRLLQDASTVTLTQFFPKVLSDLNVTNDDVSFITNGKATSSTPSLYGNKIINQDITCKNGYLHELEGLITPPETMAGFICNNASTSRYASLMNRFAIPVVYQQNPLVYTLRYFNEHPQNLNNKAVNIVGALKIDALGNDKSNACLYFDPGWNAYQSKAKENNSTEAPYQGDMGVMFVPTNEALENYFSATGEGADIWKSFGGNWDEVPDNIVADLVKNHQKYSLLSSLPHDFSIMKDEAGYDMNVSESDIVDRYVARNGVVFVINKVLPPLDYRSVMGPAKVDLSNQIFNIGMNDSHTQFMYYLRSLLSRYQFFITPDAKMAHYVDPVSMFKQTASRAYWNFSIGLNGDIQAEVHRLDNDELIETITNTKIINNRLEDILRTHTLVVNSNEEFRQAVADGQEYFVTMGYMPLRITGASTGSTISGMGNAAKVVINDASEKTNGVSYIVDGILQNTLTSTYQNLNQSSNSGVLNASSPFYEFLRLCNASNIFSNSATSSIIPGDPYVSFLQQYDYTLYVPTNEQLKEAQSKHYIPTPEELEDLYNQSAGGLETHIDSLYQIALSKLRRFIRYHIQDNSVFIKGKKESYKEYLTETINEKTQLFYPVFVTNTGNTLSVRDNIGNTASVQVADGRYNLIGRDLKFNNASGSATKYDIQNSTLIENYTCTVVHQIDRPLWYETPSAQWHTDLYKDLNEYLGN